MSLGPVEWALVAFPGNKFTGEVAPALGELIESGVVRIVDLIFITKDEEGNVASMELTNLDPADAEPFEKLGVELGNLLSEEDVEVAGEGLELNSSAALIVWENTWATRFAQAVRGADGVLVAHDRVPAEVVEAAVAAAAAA